MRWMSRSSGVVLVELVVEEGISSLLQNKSLV
jgi:hypothetical protein